MGRCSDCNDRWDIVLEPRLIRVHQQAKRAHQGWRYLTEDKAPKDLAEGEDIGDALPGKLAMKLERLGCKRGVVGRRSTTR